MGCDAVLAHADGASAQWHESLKSQHDLCCVVASVAYVAVKNTTIAHLPCIFKQGSVGICECLLMYSIQINFSVIPARQGVHHLLRP